MIAIQLQKYPAQTERVSVELTDRESSASREVPKDSTLSVTDLVYFNDSNRIVHRQYTSNTRKALGEHRPPPRTIADTMICKSATANTLHVWIYCQCSYHIWHIISYWPCCHYCTLPPSTAP